MSVSRNGNTVCLHISPVVFDDSVKSLSILLSELPGVRIATQ